MAPADLTACTASELARMIRERECSSLEAVDAHLSRIERFNPRLNALVTVAAERARREAVAADSRRAGEGTAPLHGVPITIKDGFATAGLRTTFGLPFYGTRSLLRYRPDVDAPAVARLRRAGAIVLGKTNLPLASYDWQSRHPWLGRTSNPHDLSRTAGGSSGGSAAAVAARLSPLDLGSDACGSLRVPAHFCGVLAMRPTEGRVPTEGMLPPGHPGLPHTLTAGPIARSVGDLRLAVSLLDPTIPAPKSIDPAGLRVAVSEGWGDAVVGAEVRAALHELAGALEGLGCVVEEAAPGVDARQALRTWGAIHGFEFARGFPRLIRSAPLNRLAPAAFARRYGGGHWPRILGDGFRGTRPAYEQALGELRRLLGAFEAFFQRFDVWISPVAGVTAFTHRPTGSNLMVDGQEVPYTLPLGELNAVTALVGTPCVAFPVGTDAAGLPIGLQVHGRHGDDAGVLGFVEALETAGLVRVPAPRGIEPAARTGAPPDAGPDGAVAAGPGRG